MSHTTQPPLEETALELPGPVRGCQNWGWEIDFRFPQLIALKSLFCSSSSPPSSSSTIPSLPHPLSPLLRPQFQLVLSSVTCTARSLPTMVLLPSGDHFSRLATFTVKSVSCRSQRRAGPICYLFLTGPLYSMSTSTGTGWWICVCKSQQVQQVLKGFANFFYLPKHAIWGVKTPEMCRPKANAGLTQCLRWRSCSENNRWGSL